VTCARPGRLTLGAKQIEQMAVEAQTADRDKSELQGKLKAHKGTLARYKSDLVSLRQLSLDEARVLLFLTDPVPVYPGAENPL
jgi:hypothetical protein